MSQNNPTNITFDSNPIQNRKLSFKICAELVHYPITTKPMQF